MWTTRQTLLARNLAAALLGTDWSETALGERMAAYLGPETRRSQLRLLADIQRQTQLYPPSRAMLTRQLLATRTFHQACGPLLRSQAPQRMVLTPPRFNPVRHLAPLEVPELPTVGCVARWLGLSLDDLDWFTDARRQHGRTSIPMLQHYTYALHAKSHGPPRLIEAPKPRLKTMQQRILHGLLDRVPAHAAAHGFIAGRSCRSHAEAHVGAAVVVCLDLADFFVTTPLGRVHALFRCLGYPHGAAKTLTQLCSTVTPRSVFDRLQPAARPTQAQRRSYHAPHLPQGAPTSPALANLVAWRLDTRLTGLATAFGAGYTRYADDLTFSGAAGLAAKTASLIEAVATIAADEGYALNARKTRIMRPAQRQQITGIVVNTRLNVARDSYDTLKAILHNCGRHGLEVENRDGHRDFRAHLAGRVAWVESLNPARGQRLRAMFNAIA
jgi:RNA-directed DNA polymerase